MPAWLISFCVRGRVTGKRSKKVSKHHHTAMVDRHNARVCTGNKKNWCKNIKTDIPQIASSQASESHMIYNSAWPLPPVFCMGWIYWPSIPHDSCVRWAASESHIDNIAPPFYSKWLASNIGIRDVCFSFAFFYFFMLIFMNIPTPWGFGVPTKPRLEPSIQKCNPHFRPITTQIL